MTGRTSSPVERNKEWAWHEYSTKCEHAITGWLVVELPYTCTIIINTDVHNNIILVKVITILYPIIALLRRHAVLS